MSWKPDGRQKRKEEEEDTSFETEETLDETSSCLAVEKENVRASQVDTGRFHDNGVWIVHEMRFNPNILGRYLGYRKWLKLLFCREVKIRLPRQFQFYTLIDQTSLYNENNRTCTYKNVK